MTRLQTIVEVCSRVMSVDDRNDPPSDFALGLVHLPDVTTHSDYNGSTIQPLKF